MWPLLCWLTGRNFSVKLLLAIIRPTKLQAVQEALKAVGVERMTVCDAHGYGRQRGRTETYRGVEYKINLLRKVVLEVVVNDDFVDRTVDAIEQVARTGSEGNIGDGKIFQVPVVKTVRIGETVEGPEAV
jgi:nitrogen regulatory protein P-II 1